MRSLIWHALILAVSTGAWAAPVRVADVYGKLPLSFEANAGQTDPRVKFLSRGAGYTLFLTANEAVLSLRRDEHEARVLRIRLLGASRLSKAAGVDELPGKSNYLIGNDPRQWRTGVATYKKVALRQVYPGVDLVYYGNQRQLEYDFVVGPGADPRRIRMAFEGADRVRIDEQGDVVLETPDGEVRQRKPVVYQESCGVRQVVEGRYVLRGRNKVGFQLARYDGRRRLIIDPVVTYATYLGGALNDRAFGIAADGSGNAYVTGSTNSVVFPGVLPPGTVSGGSDAFVAKLNPGGSLLVYSTYLGGTSTDEGQKIAVDGLGQAHVAGTTSSVNFPTTAGGYDTVCGAPPGAPCAGATSDAFLTKLNAAGAGFLYSTYLGGGGNDTGLAIALDSSGRIYVTGRTTSADFPFTPNAYQNLFGGFADAFVAKLDPAAVGAAGLLFSTYLGGTGDDTARAIALDSTNRTYVTGSTASDPFPTTPGVYQDFLMGIANDVFVAKLNPDSATAAGSLVYSTYIGGGGSDNGNGIAVDASGNAFVTGGTGFDTDLGGMQYPATAGVLQPAFPGGVGTTNGFVAKLNPTGTALVYSTFLGGSASDQGRSIALDSTGNAYVTGSTATTATPPLFPTANAFQTVAAGANDAFLTKLNPTGTAVVFSSFLGGPSGDDGNSLALDATGSIYVAGSSGPAAGFPTTAGSFQTAYGMGPFDAFIAKIGENQPPTANAGADRTIECAASTGTAVTLDGSGSSDPDNNPLTYTWTGPFPESPASGVNPTVTLANGIHTITLTVSDGQAPPANVTVVITVEDTTKPSLNVTLNPNVLMPPNGQYIAITATITATDACGAPAVKLVSIDSNEPDPDAVQGAALGTDDRTFQLQARRLGGGDGRVYTVTYETTDASGNKTTVSKTVTVPKNQSN